MLILIPQDKANHFIYGNLIALLAAGILANFGYNQYSRLTAVAAAGILGIGKEILDRYLNRKAVKNGLAEPHGVDINDYFATQFGGFNVALVLSI